MNSKKTIFKVITVYAFNLILYAIWMNSQKELLFYISFLLLLFESIIVITSILKRKKSSYKLKKENVKISLGLVTGLFVVISVSELEFTVFHIPFLLNFVLVAIYIAFLPSKLYK